jgi:putative peptidoglycan lipid II flippase
MEWHFHRVFLAEIAIVAVSIGFIAIWHNNIQMLPLAYATGYAFGLLQLVIGAGLLRRGDDFTSRSVRPVMRNIAELFFANQTGGLTTLVDRHIQSFLVSGGVGAVNYSGQITTSLLNLLSFREIFVVPLTQQTDRVERLERLMSGLVLLAVPISGVVACFAPDILLVLLQRGRFDASATALTAAALRIGVFSLVPAALALPLARMFQIIDRIHSIHVVYLSLAGTLAVFGYLFVIVFGWGVRGVALMQLASSIVNALVCSYLVARHGIRFSWRPILVRLTLAALVSAVASAAAIAATSHFENVWMRLTLGGTAYWLIVLLCYFLGREQLRGIAFGPRSPQDRLI